MEKTNDYIGRICTFISVAILLYRAMYDCLVNDIGILESFLSDPLSYVVTLLPVAANLLLMLVKCIYERFDSWLFINYTLKSICILIRIAIEFQIVDKYSLYVTPRTGEDITAWYRGVGLIIGITVIEGIIIGILDGGMFDDLVDYLVDYLPYHCYLFCFILGMQEALNIYPDVLQSLDFSTFVKLVILASILGVIDGIKFVFEVCFLWLKK